MDAKEMLNKFIDNVVLLLQNIWEQLKAVFDATWKGEVGTKPADVEGK